MGEDCRFVFHLFIHSMYTGLCSHYKNHAEETFLTFGTGLPLDFILWHRKAFIHLQNPPQCHRTGLPTLPSLWGKKGKVLSSFVVGSKYQKGRCPSSSWWCSAMEQEEEAGTDAQAVPPGHEEELLPCAGTEH